MATSRFHHYDSHTYKPWRYPEIDAYDRPAVARYVTIAGGVCNLAWKLHHQVQSMLNGAGAMNTTFGPGQNLEAIEKVPPKLARKHISLKCTTRRIGLQVAANSGRPGGACGHWDGNVRCIHGRHRTQEEDVVSNWLVSECGRGSQPKHWSALFRSTIYNRWGLVQNLPSPIQMKNATASPHASSLRRRHDQSDGLDGRISPTFSLSGESSPSSSQGIFSSALSPSPSTDSSSRSPSRFATIQGINYRYTSDPRDYADAWVVRRAWVSEKTEDSIADGNEGNGCKTNTDIWPINGTSSSKARQRQRQWHQQRLSETGSNCDDTAAATKGCGEGRGKRAQKLQHRQQGGDRGTAKPVTRADHLQRDLLHQNNQKAGRRSGGTAASASAAAGSAFDFSRTAPVTLVFSGGPNAGCCQASSGSTARTLNVFAASIKQLPAGWVPPHLEEQRQRLMKAAADAAQATVNAEEAARLAAADNYDYAPRSPVSDPVNLAIAMKHFGKLKQNQARPDQAISFPTNKPRRTPTRSSRYGAERLPPESEATRKVGSDSHHSTFAEMKNNTRVDKGHGETNRESSSSMAGNQSCEQDVLSTGPCSDEGIEAQTGDRSAEHTLTAAMGEEAISEHYFNVVHGHENETFGSYDFFRECVKQAVRAGLDAMMREGCDVALLARISCGIYAGNHRERLNAEYLDLVNELLAEPIGSIRDAETGAITGTSTRGHYFQEVLVPLLP